MEMLNIPPAQPQGNPTTAPKGKTDKGENTSFLKVLGKANKNAQNEQQEGAINSTGDEGTKLEGISQPSDESEEISQPIASVEDEESSTELVEEDTASDVLTLSAALNVPVEPVPSHKTEPGPIVTKGAKSADMTPLLPETDMPNVKTEVTSTSQEASVTNGTPEATTPQETAVGLATEPLPNEKMNLADSALPAELAQRTASTVPEQKMSIPANAESMVSQSMSAKNLEQAGMASNETGKQRGLMESSLGNLLQEIRPLREQSRGRQAANLNRGETASIAIQTEGSAQVIAGTQNEDSHPSFASNQEKGLFALKAEATSNDTNSANAAPFETILEGGMNGSQAAQQVSQPVTATSAEPGSIRLASGEFLSESQIVDQVLERISVDRVGNQSRIVVKMNPEELGEVKLALTMEKDQLRAQLLTQNHQVQEILEKHLPKLHEALSQQGVKLEDIQVGVDSNRHSGREAFADHRQPDTFHRHQNAPTGTANNEHMHTATASARSVSSEGLSLRI